MKRFALAGFLALSTACSATSVNSDPPRGWLAWRGPHQNGTSLETDLVDTLAPDGANHLWSYEISGRGTPVVSNGRVFALGYEGEGPELEEVIFCLDEKTGKRLWEHRESDFLSDVIYSRYAIGSPTVDPVSGNVFALTGGGLFLSFTPDGEVRWERSLPEELGRLSFPNGRVGAPRIVGDLVIMHFIFASWGPLAPARDRFYAFHKDTGEVAWFSTPGGPPKDSSFAYPVIEERDGRTLLYAGLGGGHIGCVDARTGEAIWRFPFAHGGVNSSALLFGDTLIVIHGKENVDTSETGRMAALRLDMKPDEDGVLPPDAEVWRADLVAFTSSPVLVGDRIYQTVLTGELVCVDASTGKVLWHEKLAPDQIHASPVAADGKLFVPMTNGTFHIIRPSDAGAETLCSVQLEGSCLGAPAVANGRIYVHTTERLYCFGAPGAEAPAWPLEPAVEPGEPAQLQLLPADVTLRVGDQPDYTVRRLDAGGRVVDEVAPDKVQFTLPPILSASKTGVGMVSATFEGLSTKARVRTVPTLPFVEDFEGFELKDGVALPPGHWLGAGRKWQVIELEGQKVAARRMDNPLFQRTLTLFGHPGDSNYTVQADMMSDGNRRSLSSPGLINQRYLIVLKGNYQELEVSSNMERLKVTVPYKWKKGVWYRLETRVDVNKDGSGVVRARVWPRDEAKPDAWTIEVPDPHVRTHGSAGVYGFTPQSRFTLYIDNLSVTPNE